MKWVELPGKGRNTTSLLQEFEKQFTQLSALDRTMLDTSKVLLFNKSIDSLDCEKVSLLLGTDEGFTTDWAMVKGIYTCFHKQRESNDGGLSTDPTTRRIAEEVLTQPNDARRRTDLGLVPTNMVEGPPGGVELEELTKMVGDLQIA